MFRNIHGDDMVCLRDMSTNVDLRGKFGDVTEVVSGQATILMSNSGRLVRTAGHKCHLVQLVSAMDWGPKQTVVKPSFCDTGLRQFLNKTNVSG